MPRNRTGYEPAVTDLTFSVNGTAYICLASALSAVNRRLYRQGKQYFVGGVTVETPANKVIDAAHQSTSFYTVMDTWVSHNAWKQSFNKWKDQQMSINDGRLRGTWSDFKVHMDDTHNPGLSDATTSNDTTMVAPLAGDGAAYGSGEWVMSNYTYDDNGTVRQPLFHFIGTSTHDTKIGMIAEYQLWRNQMLSGNPPQENPSNSFWREGIIGDDDTTEDIIADQEGFNDAPPYDADDMPGNDTNGDAPHFVAVCSTAGGVGRANGFKAICGLVKVVTESASLVTFHLMPGNYRGVAALPMGQ